MTPAPLRILLIDDHPGDRRLAIHEIHADMPDAEILEAGDRAALDAALVRGGFDVVVTDYQLGWSDGLRVLRQVRSCFPDCPVILLSGAMSDEFAVEAMKAGLDDYVLKDSSRIVRLPGAVRTAVEHARQQRATREAEQALRRSERQFRALIEYGSDVITILEPTGEVRYVSPSISRILGYEPAEVLGCRVFELVHPDDAEGLRRLLGKVAAGPLGTTAVMADLRMQHHDRSWRVLEGVAANVLADPAVGGIVMTAHDLSERRQAEEALRQSEEQLRQSQKMEAVGRLAGGVAHDFNNVLTAITCFNDLAMSALRKDDPLRRHGEEIGKAVARASSLTRQLLAFSRRQVLQPEVLDLNGVVRDMETMLRRLIGEDIALEVIADPDLGTVRADPGQMEQVILNLVVNARDAMPEGGRIRIETANVDLDGISTEGSNGAHGPAWVRLSISDTGCGITPEIRGQIFEPFFTTKEAGRGTGLGLSTVYGVVRQSDGHVAVDSDPGGGATFRIYLPRAQATPMESAPRPQLSADRGAETILVVEDEELVRFPVCAILRGNGYRVLEAVNGSAALRVAQHHDGPIDLLLTDLVMPGMTGRDLAERLVAERPETKILYTSGYTEHAAVGRGFADRDLAFVQKPFSPEGLLRKVREMLDGASSLPLGTERS